MSVSRSPSSSPRRLFWPVFAILLMIAVMVAVVWWRVLRPQEPLAQVAAAPSLPAQLAQSPGDLAGMGEAQLLAAARTAMHAQHLVAPAGDNAVAYYLQVLHKNPSNRVARDALREVFPFAAQAIEQTINGGSLDQAQRELDLLARVDPTNYTLTLLNSKLADRRRVAVRDDNAAAAHTDTVASVAKPQAEPAKVDTAAKPTVPEMNVAAAAPPTASVPAAPPAQSMPAPAPAKAAETAQAVKVKRTPPLLLREVRPYYPAAARRQRREGWVEVSYTVDQEGRVGHAHVVRAEPAHLFDRAAVNAVEHWQFKPARLNGTAVPAVLTSRVNFNLSR